MTPWRWPRAPAGAVVEQGGKSWFFLTADYAFGQLAGGAIPLPW